MHRRRTMTVPLKHPDRFVHRHIGPNASEVDHMLRVVDAPSLEALLDEATAAAEAMDVGYSFNGSEEANTFVVSEEWHPQTIDGVRTRAGAIGIEVVVGDHRTIDLGNARGSHASGAAGGGRIFGA